MRDKSSITPHPALLFEEDKRKIDTGIMYMQVNR